MVEQDMSVQGGQGDIEQEIADTQDQAQQQEGGEQSEYTQIAGMISDLDRRLRVLEERYGNLRKKIQLTDQNIIDSERSINKEIRNFSADVLDIKRSVADFDEKIVLFGNEMQNVAQKSDLKVMEKYLVMWSPNMFVTRKELREYLKNKKIKILGNPGEDE
jgi:predicted  nucleic acid-binding Zn-ribbon protein